MSEHFGIIDNSESTHCKRISAALRSVTWDDGFWGRRFEQCRSVTIPHVWKRLDDPELGHTTANFRIYAGLEEGEYEGSFWNDELLHKWLEAAAYVYPYTGDPDLDRQMDAAIDLIGKAQKPDGYISCAQMKFKTRFVIPRRHELYNMGHLITAACAHHRATGKTNFLDIAKKAADCIYNTFAPDPAKFANFSNTKSYIMAMVELYRVTADERYLELANIFIDVHGMEPPKDRKIGQSDIDSDPQAAAELEGSDQRQSRVPLRDEKYVVGHAVNFTYLYASAADVYMETGDEKLLLALDHLWGDLVHKKMFVHGGVCPMQHGLSIRGDRVGEAAGAAYDLPNSSAYNETCAQIGNFMWNWRMLLITGEPRFADVMELNLYNSVISSIGLEGASWFYMNPLRWYGEDQPTRDVKHRHQRYQPGEPPHRGHTCCPTNVLRTTASFHGYLYSMDDDGLFVDHYGANTFDGALPDGSELRLVQRTDYPWDGEVSITVEKAPSRECAIRLRIPDWADGASVGVNGEPQNGEVRASSYFAIRRRWVPGDRIDLDLPMGVRLLHADPRVETCRNQVAVKRGPILYCLESPDLPEGVRVSQVLLPRDVALTPRHDPDLLNGVTVLEGTALADEAEDWAGPLYRPVGASSLKEIGIRLIPYYAWANRGVAEMAVWIPLTCRKVCPTF